MMFAAYKDAMRRYADFNGRSSRPQFWFFYLVLFLSTILVVLFFVALDSFVGSNGLSGLSIFHFLIMIMVLAHVIPSYAVMARRLHDFDKSGWWMLTSFIPYLGGIAPLVIGCIEPTPGDNRFGPPPHLGGQSSLVKTFE